MARLAAFSSCSNAFGVPLSRRLSGGKEQFEGITERGGSGKLEHDGSNRQIDRYGQAPVKVNSRKKTMKNVYPKQT